MGFYENHSSMLLMRNISCCMDTSILFPIRNRVHLLLLSSFHIICYSSIQTAFVSIKESLHVYLFFSCSSVEMKSKFIISHWNMSHESTKQCMSCERIFFTQIQTYALFSLQGNWLLALASNINSGFTYLEIDHKINLTRFEILDKSHISNCL